MKLPDEIDYTDALIRFTYFYPQMSSLYYGLALKNPGAHFTE